MSSKNECLQLFLQAHAGKCSKLTPTNCRNVAQRLEFYLNSHCISQYFFIVSKRHWKTEGWRIQIVRNLYRFGPNMLVSFMLNATENNSKTGVRIYEWNSLRRFFPETYHLPMQYPKFFALQEAFLGNVHACHSALSGETMQDLTRKAT